jgi:hypothetical protein
MAEIELYQFAGSHFNEKARWVDHPGAKWVREIYRRHRRLGVAGREAPAERAGRRL